MSVPLLTVIVPAYNSEDYLDRALTTLVGYGDELEAIIVNDGSKDRTAQIADEWAARYPSVRVIHQENKGHGGAVNAGLAAATGTHVRVVDSDDWLDRRATNAVLDVLREEREAGREALDAWRTASDRRLRSGQRHIEMGMLGHAPLFTSVEGRRLPDDPAAGVAGDAHEVEAAILLDPNARPGEDGFYHLPEGK